MAEMNKELCGKKQKKITPGSNPEVISFVRLQGLEPWTP